MYTRSYGTEEDKLTLPSGYDGTAFEKEIREKAEEAAIPPDEPKLEEPSEEVGLFSRIPLLKSIRGFERLRLPFDLGSEDLVLLGIALLLFFTKDGDRECALMIALLLFIR